MFAGVMGLCLLFKDVSKPIDTARAIVYERWWAAPLLYFLFLPFYLMYEIVRYRLWSDIETLHPDPRQQGSRPQRPARGSTKRKGPTRR